MTEEKNQETQSWVKLKPEEISKKIVELAKSGTPPEKIGLILRDKHGIPKVKIFGKKIGQILKEADLGYNSEYENLLKKTENLKKHLNLNKHDYTAKRKVIQYTGKINRFKKQQSLN